MNFFKSFLARQPKHKNGLIILLAVLLLALLLGGCAQANAQQSDLIPTPEAPAEVPDTKVQLSLLAVGDNLIHGPIYRQAKDRAADGSFDFTPAYQNILSYVEAADLVYINQETPLGGTELGLSSYPMFNSPQELGDFLVQAGFNLISQANNHVLDAREKGFNNTIAYWRAQPGVVMAGIAASQADDQLRLLDCKGVSVALLAYTYGTNGLKLPKSSSGIVKYIDDDLIRAELAEARAQADVIIVSMHWGQEYQSAPNKEQKRLAQLLADNGADIIIGSHPHVIQTVATLTAADGRKVPVFYSLGNFISAQNKPETMLGGMADIQMTYDTADGSLTFDEVGLIPIVTDYTGSYHNITIYPLAQYTADQARAHGVRRNYSSFSLDYLHSLFAKRIPEKYQNLR